MTRKSEWTGMSPGSSDSARGSSSHRWDSQSSSYSSLKGDHLQEEESFVDDKETASSAVAFVVHSSRKGIIHLCADVANLIKAKKRLEHLVKTLKEENAQLRQVNASQSVSCGHTSRSSTPSPPSVDSSDSHYHYPRGRRKGSLLSGSARYRGVSPSLSTSTLTSPGEELGPSGQEVGRRGPSRRRQTSTPQRAGATQEKEAAEEEPVHNLVQNGTLTGEGGAESDIEEHVAPLGNRHQVTVEVHQSPDPEVDLGSGAKSQSEEEDISVVMESVSIQCSLCEDIHSELQQRIEEVEKEKTELENSYLKIQDELEQLNRHVETLESEKRMKDHCTVEIENELSRRNIPQTQSSVRFNDPTQLLPRLTEQASTNQKAVKSMSRITGGCTFHLEDKVIVKGDRTGRVRYIGPLKHLNQSMMFAGVQLDSAAGRHDGSIHGHRYFACPRNHGVFVPVQDVHTVVISKSTKRSKSAKPLSSFPRNPSASRNKRITPVLPSTSVKSESLPSRPVSSKSHTWFHK